MTGAFSGPVLDLAYQVVLSPHPSSDFAAQPTSHDEYWVLSRKAWPHKSQGLCIRDATAVLGVDYSTLSIILG